MLSEKPIIVLDEPTSGLDWDNMCAVANSVNYMREAGKLVFIITHGSGVYQPDRLALAGF